MLLFQILEGLLAPTFNFTHTELLINIINVFQVMITDPGTGIDNEPPLPIYDITLTELDIAGGPNPQLRWMCKKMCPPGNGQESKKEGYQK